MNHRRSKHSRIMWTEINLVGPMPVLVESTHYLTFACNVLALLIQEIRSKVSTITMSHILKPPALLNNNAIDNTRITTVLYRSPQMAQIFKKKKPSVSVCWHYPDLSTKILFALFPPYVTLNRLPGKWLSSPCRRHEGNDEHRYSATHS